MPSPTPIPAPAARRPFAWAVFWAIVLSAYFLVAYGGCNRAASKRSNVGSWYYAWERHILFVPAAIVPYMSISAPIRSGDRKKNVPLHLTRGSAGIRETTFCPVFRS